MKVISNVLFILILFFLTNCGERDNLPPELGQKYPESVSFSVSNPADLERNDVSVFIDLSNLKKKQSDFNQDAFLIWSGEKEVPSQAVDTNDDGEFDAIILNIDLAANEQKGLSIRFNPNGELIREYPKRTQAELSHKVGGEFVERKYIGGEFKNVSYLKLPPEHTDHSSFIRYEGPGWESDKVGYRFYLDWRNATDIFGKKVPDMVLQNVGLDGFESYHHPADWGMDVLKVGETLGVGSIALWEDSKANRVAETDSVDCKIVANGPLYSQIRTRYFGWKVGSAQYDLISDLSITAGSRMTKHQLEIRGGAQNLCSGLAKHEDTDYFQSDMDKGGWAYIALWGKQSLAGDNLGTAVLFDTKWLSEINEDELNYVVVLKPYENKVMYYFGAAWEQEPNGIKTKEGFQEYLNQTIKDLNSPLVVNY
jgi:hypothetical protein